MNVSQVLHCAALDRGKRLNGLLWGIGASLASNIRYFANRNMDYQ